jgi:hypothetical protein
MLLQLGIEIDAIGGYVDFFRAPEGELFFDQLFEIAVLLLIVARNVETARGT